jgi:hypothetical protein
MRGFLPWCVRHQKNKDQPLKDNSRQMIGNKEHDAWHIGFNINISKKRKGKETFASRRNSKQKGDVKS